MASPAPRRNVRYETTGSAAQMGERRRAQGSVAGATARRKVRYGTGRPQVNLVCRPAIPRRRLLPIPSIESWCRPTLEPPPWRHFRITLKPLSILRLRRLSNFLRVPLAPDGRQGAAPSARRLTPAIPGSPGEFATLLTDYPHIIR